MYIYFSSWRPSSATCRGWHVFDKHHLLRSGPVTEPDHSAHLVSCIEDRGDCRRLRRGACRPIPRRLALPPPQEHRRLPNPGRRVRACECGCDRHLSSFLKSSARPTVRIAAERDDAPSKIDRPPRCSRLLRLSRSRSRSPPPPPAAATTTTTTSVCTRTA